MTQHVSRLRPVTVDVNIAAGTITICFAGGMCRIVRLPLGRVRPEPGDVLELPDGTSATVESVEDSTEDPEFELE